MSIPLLHGLSLLTLSLATSTAFAADKSHDCSRLADPTERLACYDTAFPPAAGARGPIDIEAERAKALREFGLNKVQLTARLPEPLRDLAPERIEAKVIRVTPRATGERVVALDNGQIWLLTEVTSKGRLKPGDPIVVRTAALATFMMVTPGRVALRAKRIK